MRTAVTAGLPPDIEDTCQLIERLEIHRQCLDEALADAYTELIDRLDGHLDPELARLLRARPWLDTGEPRPADARELSAGVSWLAACGSKAAG